MENAENRENFHLLDSAAFLICLDDIEFNGDIPQTCHNFLHGNHPESPNLNRWFDKSFSIMITKDGEAAINFEHSWADGVTLLRFFADTINDSTKHRFAEPNVFSTPLYCEREVRRLDFQFDDQTREAERSAKLKLNDFTSNLNISNVKYNKMDRGYFKKNKLSPDAMYQLGFQMAFHQMYNFTPPTYESCSTAAFKHGRTENIRAATMETQMASKAFLENHRPKGISTI